MTASSARNMIKELRAIFGERLQENVRMANYTTAQVGGPADALLIAQSSDELEDFVRKVWALDLPLYIIGSGSNLLVSDLGIHGVVIINRAHTIKVNTHVDPPIVRAESGAILGTVARQVALRGLSGMEWAATIPGTVGGAVYGNAGAQGSDTKATLELAEILHRVKDKVSLTSDQMGYAYRSSILKRDPGNAVILAAQFRLSTTTVEAVQEKMSEFSSRRRATQPPGASMGSMFKNPSGNHAGRLIEAAGLKGTRIGGAVISTLHANFFVNDQSATASDVFGLIQLARQTVLEKTGVALELEIEMIGDWNESQPSSKTAKQAKKAGE
jgi:UDP-N-acetylmuramate dehydrogenase